jgi:CheY-like chemotaxis protein
MHDAYRPLIYRSNTTSSVSRKFLDEKSNKGFMMHLNFLRNPPISNRDRWESPVSNYMNANLTDRIIQILGRNSIQLQNYWRCCCCLCSKQSQESLEVQVGEILRVFHEYNASSLDRDDAVPLENVLDEIPSLAYNFTLHTSLSEKITFFTKNILEQNQFIDRLIDTNNDKMRNAILEISETSATLDKDISDLGTGLQLILISSERLLKIFNENLTTYESIKREVTLEPNFESLLQKDLDLFSMQLQSISQDLASIVSPTSVYCNCLCFLVPKNSVGADLPVLEDLQRALDETYFHPLFVQKQTISNLILQAEANIQKIQEFMKKNTPEIRGVLEKISWASKNESHLENIQAVMSMSLELLELFHQSSGEIFFPQKIRSMEESLQVLQGKRILVVDDSTTIVKMMERLLRKHGMHIETAFNGQEAVAKLSSKGLPFDLVLMDINMPVCNGLDATMQIRQLGLSTLPILAISAEESLQAKVQALRAGMNAFLGKPHKNEDLFAAMAQLILDFA